MDTTAPIGQVVIVAGGELRTTIQSPGGATVIAADSGYDHAVTAGIPVDVLIGDLDSISPAGRRHATTTGVTVTEHPVDKDSSDLELALRAAIDRGATRIDVYGGEGGTVGHLVAGALALTSGDLDGIDVRWHVESGTIHVARPTHPVAVSGSPGDVLTIVPVGDLSGVTTTGLRWQLDGDALDAGSTRGVSNRLEHRRATVRIDAGVALVIMEGT